MTDNPAAVNDFASIAAGLRDLEKAAFPVEGDVTVAVCLACEGGGWEMYGLGCGDPHFRPCEVCGNPEDHPCP